MPEILAQAIIPDTSPSDVILLPTSETASADGAPEAESIALVRSSGPELTVWLRDAVNTLLKELPLALERPDGALLERGTFTYEQEQVWAYDWYDNPRRLLVARCDDIETARRLAVVLDALLADS